MNDTMYTRYPSWSVFTYNALTIVHFLLGGAGFILGYNYWLGWLLGPLYLLFAFSEMYLIMPLKVCPNCVYYKLDNSLCISGVNLFSRKIAREGNINEFGRRALGTFCPNNLYLASLALPIVGIIPALFLNFSFILLAILFVLIGLLLFRFFIVFPRIACNHCRAKNVCPNARAMGLSNAADAR